MEGKPCSRFIVAENEEQAFLHCYSKEEDRNISSRSSCKVEEVKIEGYEISVRKIS
jgi:hypothetical protein